MKAHRVYINPDGQMIDGCYARVIREHMRRIGKPLSVPVYLICDLDGTDDWWTDQDRDQMRRDRMGGRKVLH